MTNEEAIKRLESIKETYESFTCGLDDIYLDIEALEYAIGYLKEISQCPYDAKKRGVRYGKLLKQKSGKWIRHDINYTTTGHSIYYDCFLCGCAAPCTETADKILWKLSNYCPDCGAEMKNGGQWR